MKSVLTMFAVLVLSSCSYSGEVVEDEPAEEVEQSYGNYCDYFENPCSANKWCDVPVGCILQQAGTCKPIPNNCPTPVAEYCGCDGITYASECLAHAAGEDTAHAGACP